MLAQLTVLLALGVLCSPAPISTPPHSSKVYPIIEEVQSDMKNNSVTIADMSWTPMEIKNESCMRSNLKTFMESLKANETKNKKVITQLSIVYEHEHLFLSIISPQVSGEGCRTVQVSRDKFKQEFTTFLGYLYEKL